ncbi:uncharacterized protein [Panulirus ornatus]|uniref:uncharacterized protein isoform X2 n=1 Tax=Panulirus ornatus TaxID=150431 RepID=UPI003A86CF29
MNNKVLHEELQAVEPQRWHLVCLRRDGRTQKLGFFLDGLELLSQDTPGYLPLNGTLVLGSGWNSFTDSYPVSQPFLGSVTGFNLWSRALTQMEMYSVGSCDEPNNILLAWHNIPWKMTGKVQERLTDPCLEITNLTYLFLPIKMSYAHAAWFCSSHGLNFPFPTSEQDNRKITSLMATGMESCLSNYSPYVTVWLNISYDSDLQQWVGGPDRRPITYSKFNPIHQPDNKVLIIQQNGLWVPIFNTLTQCTLCEGKMLKLEVTIRGLCADEGIEADYMAMYPRSDSKGIYYLQGATGLRLHHLSPNHWIIQHLPSNNTVATYEGTEFFLGRKEWSLKSTTVCGRRKSLHGPHNLTISWCGPGNYTCWSGECVPLTHRCSFDSECHDNTDEKDCNLIYTPLDYQYHLPPYSPYLNLDFTISLSKVSSVDLMGQLVEANFKVKLRWRDHRLTFHNLKEDPRLNMLQSQYSYQKVRMRFPKGRVWYPSIKVVDEERLAGVVKPLSQLMIRRTTSGEDHVTACRTTATWGSSASSSSVVLPTTCFPPTCPPPC